MFFDSNYDKHKSSIAKNQYRCNCGHSVYINPHCDKYICKYCGNYVYRNEKNNIEYITLISRLQMSYIKFLKKEMNCR